MIVDLGCGKGRLFHYLCTKGFRGICIGIELWKEVALQTRKHLAKYDNVTIVHDNFLNCDFPQNFTIAYYFNSANREVTSELIKKLESQKKRFKFVYINALYADLKNGRRGWSILYEFDTGYRLDKTLHSIIFEHNPAKEG